MATSQEWQTRLDLILDIRMVISHLSLDEPNTELYIQGLIDSDNEAQLIVLESAWIIVEQEIQNINDKEARIKNGKIVRAICDSVLDIIAGWNLSNGLSSAQIDTMQTDYADIQSALNSFRPEKAKTLLLAKTPDGTLVTQVMYDEILGMLP